MSDTVGKVFLSAVVLALSPFVELVTGAAPFGALGATAALFTIWGMEDIAPDGGGE